MCIFCKIINGDIPSHKIYEDEYTYAFLDIANDVVGHTLVIPKVHFENIIDVPSETLEKVMITVKKISEHYVNNVGYTGINILNASGKDAEQSVFHLHFHIIPREHDDGITMWPKLDKVTANLSEVRERLKID